jgi:hypothetical protein
MMTHLEPKWQSLVNLGYRKTSNKYGLVSRLDRPDWAAHLEKETNRAVDADEIYGQWEDYWRRCRSKDTLEFGAELPRNFPSSSGARTGYRRKPGDPEATVLTWKQRAEIAEAKLQRQDWLNWRSEMQCSAKADEDPYAWLGRIAFWVLMAALAVILAIASIKFGGPKC